MKRTFVLAAVACLLALSCVAANPDPFELKLADLSGANHSLSEFRGKVLAVNFWATWCVPCGAEMPLLVQAQKKYADRLNIVAVSIDEKQAFPLISKWVRNRKVPFTVWVGGDTGLLEKLELGQAVPDTIFFGTDGRVVTRVKGALHKEELASILEWLIDGKGQVPPAVIDNLQKHK